MSQRNNSIPKSHKIKSLSHFLTLWQDAHSSAEKNGWDFILPYYDNNIIFKDSIQEINGMEKFSEMTRRLDKRSKSMRFIIHNCAMQKDIIFMEWEMVISYWKFPKSSVYGSSRMRLKNGKVIEQRDYYDLWGDIFDNVPFFRKIYRWFMRKAFG